MGNSKKIEESTIENVIGQIVPGDERGIRNARKSVASGSMGLWVYLLAFASGQGGFGELEKLCSFCIVASSALRLVADEALSNIITIA